MTATDSRFYLIKQDVIKLGFILKIISELWELNVNKSSNLQGLWLFHIIRRTHNWFGFICIFIVSYSCFSKHWISHDLTYDIIDSVLKDNYES